jgi:hypothetical protein
MSPKHRRDESGSPQQMRGIDRGRRRALTRVAFDLADQDDAV